jgi:multidrug efflux pump subunit AcrB
VYRAEETPPRARGIHGRQAGGAARYRHERGLQVDRWSRDFGVFLDRYAATAPSGVDISTSYDQAGYTEARLRDVLANLAIGMMLVLLVLLFTLGLRAATVVAVILPLCTLLSLLLMYQIGLPIHQMSVTGLVVALGLLVDGSIVMTDEVRKRLLDGRHTAGCDHAAPCRACAYPLLSSTLTTVLAFLPMVLLPGPAGDFLGSIAKAVVIMLSTSLLLALVITPVLAARLLPGGLDGEPDTGGTAVCQWRRRARAERSLRLVRAPPGGSVALALALPVSGFLAFPTLTAQFFPGTDRDQIVVQRRAAAGPLDRRHLPPGPLP